MVLTEYVGVGPKWCVEIVARGRSISSGKRERETERDSVLVVRVVVVVVFVCETKVWYF